MGARNFGHEGFRQFPFRFNRNEGGWAWWGWGGDYPYGFDDGGYYSFYYSPDNSYGAPYPSMPSYQQGLGRPNLRPVYQANYGPSSGWDGTSTIEVLVPPKAEVWFDGQKTKQMGGARYLEMPPMSAGQSTNCEIRVTWMANGKSVTETRDVQVQAGSQRIVNFLVGGSDKKASD
jgi:uncharacterized protein (TIGR03000 family)